MRIVILLGIGILRAVDPLERGIAAAEREFTECAVFAAAQVRDTDAGTMLISVPTKAAAPASDTAYPRRRPRSRLKIPTENSPFDRPVKS